jgi:hypothetical protein
MLPVLIQRSRLKRIVQLVLGGRLSRRIEVLSMRFAMLQCRFSLELNVLTVEGEVEEG